MRQLTAVGTAIGTAVKIRHQRSHGSVSGVVYESVPCRQVSNTDNQKTRVRDMNSSLHTTADKSRPKDDVQA